MDNLLLSMVNSYYRCKFPTHQPHPNPKNPTPKRQPQNANPRPHPVPCVRKLLIYDQIMLVNEIYYGYLHVKSGFVWLNMLRCG